MALNLDPAALLQTAITMAGPEGLPAGRLGTFQQPRRLPLGEAATARLIQGIYTTLMTLDLLTGDTGATGERLRLDDVLTRMVELLLLPELQQAAPLEEEQGASSWAARQKLEPLLAWMEAQANWSRRTLQQLFREAHGRTPMQWVRHRRLQRALQRLKHPRPGDTVTSIRQAAGFFSAATFYREFQREFGCSPSSVLRQ